MVNYQNGKIYKIVNDVNNDYYIGSTTEPTLARRMVYHRCASTQQIKSNLYRTMNRIGIEHFKISLIELYPCNSKDELNSREEYWIGELKPVITMSPEYTEHEKEILKARKKENNKRYYKENKEEIAKKQKENKEMIAEYGKRYREKNKEKIAERIQRYRHENKEKIAERRGTKYECNCGTIVTIRHRLRHEQSKTHNEAYDTGRCKYKTIIFLD